MQDNANKPDKPAWATLRQAAKYCGLSVRTIEKAASDGLVETSHVRLLDTTRGRRLVNLGSIDRWIESGIGFKAELPHLRGNSNREGDRHEG